MGDVEKLTPQNLLLLLQFVAPGFLAVYFRSLFVRRIETSLTDNLLLFVVLSVLYSFVTLPLWRWSSSRPASGIGLWAVWFASLVAIPVTGGTLLGVATQKGWLRRALAAIALRPLSPYRTGWDWAFSQIRGPAFVLVTLDDGSSIAGLFSGRSLAASDHANRDLYLETAYLVDDDGRWVERTPRQSILVSGKTIRYVEFSLGGDHEGTLPPDPRGLSAPTGQGSERVSGARRTTAATTAPEVHDGGASSTA